MIECLQKERKQKITGVKRKETKKVLEWAMGTVAGASGALSLTLGAQALLFFFNDRCAHFINADLPSSSKHLPLTISLSILSLLPSPSSTPLNIFIALVYLLVLYNINVHIIFISYSRFSFRFLFSITCVSVYLYFVGFDFLPFLFIEFNCGPPRTWNHNCFTSLSRLKGLTSGFTLKIQKKNFHNSGANIVLGKMSMMGSKQFFCFFLLKINVFPKCEN